ncbi:MAG: ExeM/NucH family extracellular endonuclease [Longimicrobiaceae bacterium]
MHPIWKHVRTRALAVALLPSLLLAACDRGLTTPVVPIDGAQLSTAQVGSPNVVISQVYGAGGNSGAVLANDYVELFNRGATTVSLDGWSIQYASATGTGNFGANSGLLVTLSGSLAPGQYYLVQLAGGSNGAPLPAADRVGTIGMAAGAGKVALVTGTTTLGCNGGSSTCSPEQFARILDLVGYGSANFYEGTGAAPTISIILAAFRGNDGCTDTDDNTKDFATGTPAPRNTASALNPCTVVDPAPTVASTTPAAGATGFPVGGTIGITFSESVSVTGNWFTISCTISGPRTATVSGEGATYSLQPAADLVGGESCSVTIVAAQVADEGGNTMAADHSWSFTAAGGLACGDPYTATYTIQGSGMTTPIDKQIITTEGVVVGDYEGPSPALQGFYLQDLTGDNDSLTSDGIFIFNGSKDDVKLGDIVRVTGAAGEAFGQTQITASAVVSCGTGSVNPVDLTLPLPDASYLERFEGMLVRLPQTLYVTEHFQLGRFGEVVMSSGGRLMQPTSVAAPGAAAQAKQAENNLNRIVIDDGSSRQNPDPILFGRGGSPLSASNTLRGGDTATGIVGVLGYAFSAYRVQPVDALGGGVPQFVAANPRPAAPAPVKGALKVATMNLLNYFNTFGSGCGNPEGGTSTGCRGADDAAEFERQWRKTVAAIIAMDIDVLGIVEIENDGYGPESAIADLVSKLNDASAPGVYAFIDVDAATGQKNALGTDAIKVGLIYQPARVKPVGTTAVLNSFAFVNGGDPAPRNRASLAQALEHPSGARFIVNVNHFKSKGSACSTSPDLGDGQGNCNLVRKKAADELLKWLATDPTGTADPDVLIVGDLNSYAKEDPITALINGGYTNLIESRVGANAYSYVFDGQWGYLDHALASTTLASQVTGVTEWHINADEPNVLDYNVNFKTANLQNSLYSPDQYRVSDHDPVIVGLTLIAPPGKGTPPIRK